MVPLAFLAPFLFVNPAFAMTQNSFMTNFVQNGPIQKAFGVAFEFLRGSLGLNISSSIGLTIILFSFCMKLIEFPFFYRLQ